MINFVCSDIHSFYDEFIQALNEAGFDKENNDHRLVILGDMLDRGSKAKELLDYVLSLPQDRFFYVLGNHDDLFFDLLYALEHNIGINGAHRSNGTIDTICQFTGLTEVDLYAHTYNYEKDIANNKYIKKYIKLIKERAVDYLEDDKYVYVHGWVPFVLQDGHDPNQKESEFSCVMYPKIDLDANEEMWRQAKWYNGMQEWKRGIVLKDKTIICGHWHTSFGNYHYHNKGSGEFEDDSDFNPFIDKGIIALDGCTAYSHKVNVIKINEKGEVI